MKSLIIALGLLFILPSAQVPPPLPILQKMPAPTGNLIIITIDGFRWQEVFNGADESLINDTLVTPDTETMKMLYWSNQLKERRQKLMPFLWSVFSGNGQLYGNRAFDNRVNTSNIYSVSYPGYNEIFTGNTDLRITSNRRKINSNRNVLGYLNTLPDFKGSVVAFTSWDLFPYILNEKDNDFMVNSGYEQLNGEGVHEEVETDEENSATNTLIDAMQTKVITNAGAMRHDQLTFLAAKEYLKKKSPRVLFLGLGEADEFAHAGRYDLYLEQANKVDRMIAELWHWIQSTPGYKNNTTLLITTDHGRGSSKWKSHGAFISGSSQTWLGLMGPGIEALGEVREKKQIYQKQLAGLMASLVGEQFGEEYGMAKD